MKPDTDLMVPLTITDDDGDQLVDCADPDCESRPCSAGICIDGICQ